MNNQRLIIVLLVAAYVFSPTLMSWMLSPNGAWYRPYILWGIVILIAYIISGRRPPNEF